MIIYARKILMFDIFGMKFWFFFFFLEFRFLKVNNNLKERLSWYIFFVVSITKYRFTLLEN